MERDLEKEKRDHLSSLEKNRNLNTRLAELERELKIAKDSLNISQTKNEELSITLKSKHSELEDTLIQLGSAKIKCGEMEHDIKVCFCLLIMIIFAPFIYFYAFFHVFQVFQVFHIFHVYLFHIIQH